MRRQQNFNKFKENKESIEKTKRVQEIAEYQVEDGDVVILSGSYNGLRITELWEKGSVERDWIINKLWILGDEEVNKVIRKLLCK